MEVKNKRKEMLYLIIGIVTLMALVIGAAYAYFQAQNGTSATANMQTTTGTVDNLTFDKGENISLSVNQDNFKEHGDNAKGETTVKTTLIANDTTGITEEYKYNIYLEITKNDLEYSSYKEIEGERTQVFTNEYDKTLGNNIDYNGLTNGYEGIPELFLTVIGPDGKEYTASTIGTHYTNEFDYQKDEIESIKVGGYDITQLREGIYPIAEDIPIKVLQNDGGLKEDEWEVTVTYKNLDNTQIINLNREFKARVRIQKEKIANDLMDVCSSGDNLKECIIKLHDNSEYGASNLILHDGEKDYPEETNYQLEAGDNSYRYTGSFEKVNNYICLGTECSTNPNDETYHNLYRIVGVFGDEIKLVKADYANKEQLGAGAQKPTEDLDNLDEIDSKYGSYTSVVYKEKSGSPDEQNAFSHHYKGSLTEVDRYRWQENGTSTTVADWKTSLLNKIHLNNVYLGKIDSKYQSLILKHEWIYGNGNATSNNIALGTNAKSVYNNEVGNSITNQQTDSEKIGLLYVSDYLYGASPEQWSKQPYSGIWTYNLNIGRSDKFGNPAESFSEGVINTDYRSSTDSNWIHLGLWEWLITQQYDSPVHAYSVYSVGSIFSSGNNYVGERPYVVRPSLYINNTTKIKEGTGTFNDPYTLLVEE